MLVKIFEWNKNAVNCATYIGSSHFGEWHADCKWLQEFRVVLNTVSRNFSHITLQQNYSIILKVYAQCFLKPSDATIVNARKCDIRIHSPSGLRGLLCNDTIDHWRHCLNDAEHDFEEIPLFYLFYVQWRRQSGARRPQSLPFDPVWVPQTVRELAFTQRQVGVQAIIKHNNIF